MKRMICTLLCLVMALSLAACGQSATTATATSAAAPAATERTCSGTQRYRARRPDGPAAGAHGSEPWGRR